MIGLQAYQKALAYSKVFFLYSSSDQGLIVFEAQHIIFINTTVINLANRGLKLGQLGIICGAQIDSLATHGYQNSARVVLAFRGWYPPLRPTKTKLGLITLVA